MIRICELIQEKIAWEKSLAEMEQAHILSCKDCGQTALAFAELETLVHEELAVKIPKGFADRVMSRVNTLEDEKISYLDVLLPRLQAWFLLRPVQIGFASVSGALGFLSMLRFVLDIFVPVTG